MTMRALELDFLRRGRRAGWAAWTLLAVAITFALDIGWSWHVLREEVSRKEARLVANAGEMRPAELMKVSSQRAPQRPLREGELAAARDTLHRLSIPWDALFRALEEAQTDRVALLSIEPDAGNGTVALTGEAKDYFAVLSYVATLERQKSLGRVHLIRHETRLNEPRRPVAFTISASWKERK